MPRLSAIPGYPLGRRSSDQIHDPELRKLLNPTILQTLRLADYLVRHVTENRDDVLDGTGWEEVMSGSEPSLQSIAYLRTASRHLQLGKELPVTFSFCNSGCFDYKLK